MSINTLRHLKMGVTGYFLSIISIPTLVCLVNVVFESCQLESFLDGLEHLQRQGCIYKVQFQYIFI